MAAATSSALAVGGSARSVKPAGFMDSASARMCAGISIPWANTMVSAMTLLWDRACVCPRRYCAGVADVSSAPDERAVLQPAQETHQRPEHQEIDDRRHHEGRRVVGDALRLARLVEQLGHRHHAP